MDKDEIKQLRIKVSEYQRGIAQVEAKLAEAKERSITAREEIKNLRKLVDTQQQILRLVKDCSSFINLGD